MVPNHPTKIATSENAPHSMVDCIADGYLIGIHGLRVPIGRTYAREVRQEVRKMTNETKKEENGGMAYEET